MKAGGVSIGLISDTHGLLRPEAIAALEGCAAIVHAGDIGAPQVLEALGRLAPVTAVRGNNDTEPWARGLPGVARREADLVVSGHSHKPFAGTREGVLFVNPGSAGPRRFTLPVTVARVDVVAGVPAATIVPLARATPPSRTPGRTPAARRGSAPPPSRSPRR